MSRGSYADLEIARAVGDCVYSASGVEYTDLFCGSGTVLLGHADPHVTESLRGQLGRVWNTGVFGSAPRDRALEAIARFFPGEYRPARLCSTGMEAAELALRISRVHSGRAEYLGFQGAMHGKSMATAHLGWSNAGVELPKIHRLPYVPRIGEPELTERLHALLQQRTIAAVFVEPFQASAGGHMASPELFRTLVSLCRETGTLLVVDEILTGFYRTGGAFLYPTLGLEPDIILLGKAMGNGFPVSAVVARRSIDVTPAMLPSSTFAGNPLAASAVEATLARMDTLPMRELVGSVDAIVREELRALPQMGAVVRGLGALWVIELPSSAEVEQVASALYDARVVVSVVGNCLRVLPPATVEEPRLRSACRAISRACRDALGGA